MEGFGTYGGERLGGRGVPFFFCYFGSVGGSGCVDEVCK